MKKGHLTALERRLVVEALFGNLKKQEHRETSYDVAMALNMEMDLTVLSMRGSLPEPIKRPVVSDEEFKRDPASVQARVEAYNNSIAEHYTSLNNTIVPFTLSEEHVKHILTVLSETEVKSPGVQVIFGRLGRRLRDILAGAYVPPAPAPTETSGSGAGI